MINQRRDDASRYPARSRRPAPSIEQRPFSPQTRSPPARCSAWRAFRPSSPQARSTTALTPNNWPPRSPRCGGAVGAARPARDGPAARRRHAARLRNGVGTCVHLLSIPPGRWSDIVGAADLVVPSTASGPRVCWRCWPPAGPWSRPSIPATVRLVVPNSAGLVYRPGDVSGMAAALQRLLTTPALRHGMASRAGEVARRHHLQMRLQQYDEGNRMRNVLGRLVIWVAEILDRNLLTVPDVDEYYPPSDPVRRTGQRGDRETERTRPIF